MNKFSVVFVGLAGLFLAGSAAVAQDSDAQAGNAANGKNLWIADNCYSCHGTDGHGGMAPTLAPNPIPLVAFKAIVRHPPPGGMPTFPAKYVSDSDLQDMWAYLKSIPSPPPVKDIPLLNQ